MSAPSRQPYKGDRQASAATNNFSLAGVNSAPPLYAPNGGTYVDPEYQEFNPQYNQPTNVRYLLALLQDFVITYSYAPLTRFVFRLGKRQ